MQRKKDFSIPNDPISEAFDYRLGSVMPKDSVLKGLKIVNDDTVFNVSYSIDGNRNRITPNHSSSKKEYALIFGCSIAFGEGLNDDETFAYYLQQNSKNCNAYNFAQSGTATNFMLAKLQSFHLSKGVNEKKGKAYYIFFWDHVYRSLGTLNRYTTWMHLSPNFESQNGKIVQKKLFKNGRPIRSWLYENLYQTNIVKYFELDIPFSIQNHHLDFIADLILDSKKAYQKEFKNDEFEVVFYPTYIEYTPQQLNYLKQALTKRGVHFTDLNNVLKYGGEHTLGGDPHPNKATNEKLAKALVKRLGL